MNDRVLVAKMIAYIEQNLLEPISADDMAVRAGYSLTRFRQKFYAVTGDTPSGYLRKRRLTEASKEILDGQRIVDIAMRWGYSSQENFTTAFRSYFGVTPHELSQIEGKYKRFIRRMREAYTVMEIANLKQANICTNLIGCLKGAADHFDLDLNMPMLFGLTGHAFLTNIHDELCPSGPYVWNNETLYDLLNEQGIELVTTYEVSKQSSAQGRLDLERKLRDHLDQGALVILNFLENQLVSGYDEQGLLLLQSWGDDTPTEIKSITTGSWEEVLKDEGWAHFTVIRRRSSTVPLLQTARRALNYGNELWEEGHKHAMPGYQTGADAYDAWVHALESGKFNAHGNWWNAMVWAECKEFGARFLNELAELTSSSSAQELCAELGKSYERAGAAIRKVTNRESTVDAHISALREAREAEAAAAGKLEKLAAALA